MPGAKPGAALPHWLHARISHRDESPTEQQLVPYLKERVYVTFIGLAVLLAVSGHGGETDAAGAVTSLLIAAVGAGLAGLISEIVAHLAV